MASIIFSWGNAICYTFIILSIHVFGFPQHFFFNWNLIQFEPVEKNKQWNKHERIKERIKPSPILT